MNFSALNRSLLAACAALTLLGSPPARAGLDDSYSEAEKISFAFFRLSGIPVDFDGWAKSNDAYVYAKSSEKEKILAAQKERLKTGFEYYDPEEDLVHLELPVEVSRRAPANRNPSAHPVQIRFKTLSGLFIPVQLGNIWLAVVPDTLSSYQTIRLNDEEYAHFEESLHFATPASFLADATVDLWLRPNDANIRFPITMGRIQYWPLTADVASVSLWDVTRKDLLWKQDAPWFVPPDSNGLIGLYKD